MKKNYYYPPSWVQKFLGTIRIIAFLCFISVFQVSALPIVGQDLRLNLKMKNAKLEDVLLNIEKNSDYRFVYQSEDLSGKKLINIDVEQKTVFEVLEDVLPQLKLNYEVFDKYIAIKSNNDSSGNDNITQQQKNISGCVTDVSGNPLPGVTVVIKGTTNGIITDADGNYSLKVPKNATVIFSFVGMKSKEMVVGSQTTINVTMETYAIGIEEVVAIGYGTVKKSDLTGSVSSVGNEEISAFPTTNAVQALSGRVSGVQIKQNSGEPGGSISVRIRGTNSIMGSNEPLYVVDGFPVSGSDLTVINNSDIESLEILKDASATAIYGSRGANGVVLITTKSGKSGQTKVDLRTSFGVQSLRKKLDLCNGTEYANIYNEMSKNEGLTPVFSQAEIDAIGEGFDWQDFCFRKALIQNEDFTVSGGNEKIQYSVSGSVFKQDGIIKNSNFNRYSFRTKLNHNISKKFSLSYNILLTKTDQQNQNSGNSTRGNTLISAIVGAYPTVTPYNEDGTYRNLGETYPWGTQLRNPLDFINERISLGTSNKVLSNAAITYKPFSKLSIRILGGIENTDDRSDYYQTLKSVDSPGRASISTNQFTSLLNENTATYMSSFGKNSITVMAGFTFQNFKNKNQHCSGTGFLSDVTETYNIGAASIPGIPSSSYSLSALLSGIGRLNYSYDNKYLATVTFRTDGSSKYSEGNKWGKFPSLALAWKISNESFMQGIQFLSDLKLRASMGVTGSQAVDPYATLTQLNSGKVVFGNAFYTSFAPGTTLPGNLKWESTKQIDIGFDAGFINNRIRITADYYNKKTEDLLNSVLLPSSLGYYSTIKNVGSIRNSGFELDLSANILSEGELKWDVSGNIAFNRSEVLSLYGGEDIKGGNYNLSIMDDYFNILREGEAFDVFYGYTVNGYDETGHLQYLDRNDDGLINEYDKTVIGDPNPNFIYGFNSELSYKNFDLSIFLQGVQGNDIMNLSAPSITLDYGFGLNTLKAAYDDHWTPNNTDAAYPIISSSENVKASDRFIEDGSYLRLKNIQLAYNLPCDNLGIKFIRSAQIFVSGQNLLTLTNYSWWDPDVNSNGGSNSIRQGIDYNTYPTAKTVTLGINIGF